VELSPLIPFYLKGPRPMGFVYEGCAHVA
jgi:hypothetical protein